MENKLLVDRVIHAGEEAAGQYLRCEIPNMEPFDENIEKTGVQRDVRKRERRMHRELHVHAVGREILECPQLLQGKAENKRDARRDDGGVDVPHVENTCQEIQE